MTAVAIGQNWRHKVSGNVVRVVARAVTQTPRWCVAAVGPRGYRGSLRESSLLKRYELCTERKEETCDGSGVLPARRSR